MEHFFNFYNHPPYSSKLAKMTKIKPVKLVDKYFVPDCKKNLKLKDWEITDVVELSGSSLAEVIAKVKEAYSEDVSIRISDKGVLFNGVFYEERRNHNKEYLSGKSSPSTLGMLISGDLIREREFQNAPSELYFLRFNTESLMRLPPKRNYAGLTDLVKKFEWGRATS